jgi:hypothetical protein
LQGQSGAQETIDLESVCFLSIIGSMPTTTVSISEAKQRLGEIADRAIEGEHIVIVRKSKLLVLKPLEVPEPVPMRPPGYFQDCYDKDAAKESNRLAARSVRRIVK